MKRLQKSTVVASIIDDAATNAIVEKIKNTIESNMDMVNPNPYHSYFYLSVLSNAKRADNNETTVIIITKLCTCTDKPYSISLDLETLQTWFNPPEEWVDRLNPGYVNFIHELNSKLILSPDGTNFLSTWLTPMEIEDIKSDYDEYFTLQY